jgi:tripartite-type tricarboxylate transporter receptor subunit TctC
VHPSLPVHDVRELVDYAKKNPGKLAYGSAGIGTMHHIMGELLKQKTGIEMVHVPYRGGAPLMQDLLAGNVKVSFNTLPTALPQAQAGLIRIIAVAEKARLPELHAHNRRDHSRHHQYRLERPARTCGHAGGDHR